MNSFQIKKKYIVGLGNWLGSLALSGKQSRARTKFVALLEEALQRVEKDRKAILTEVAEKEDNGELKLTEENGTKNYIVPDDKQEQFNKDISDLYEEDAELTGPESAPIFLIVKNIVLDFDGKIDGSQAAAYDKWCEAFEKWGDIK